MKVRVFPLRQYEKHFIDACNQFNVEYEFGGIPTCDYSFEGFNVDLDGIPYEESFKWFVAYVYINKESTLKNILMSYRRRIEYNG